MWNLMMKVIDNFRNYHLENDSNFLSCMMNHPAAKLSSGGVERFMRYNVALKSSGHSQMLLKIKKLKLSIES